MKPFAALIPCISLTLLAQTTPATQEQKDFFENRIRPVLAQNCFGCHTNSRMGGLRLDSRDGLVKGGGSGPALVPGDPDKSLIVVALRQTTDLKMPKNGHLTAAQIQDISSWIKDGAIWPEDAAISHGTFTIRADQRKFWSFQPLHKPELPKVRDTAWPVSDIDRFVLAKLEQQGMKPALAADRRSLLRRVTYDLTGLPATYEEVKAFESDKSPNAYEKVVDHLLASPHYGELWARHWLDVTRYAEDDYRIAQKDMHKERYKFAHTYRDWVIASLNGDMSFDTFVKAQLAADQMDEKTRPQMLPALGLNGLGVWQFNDNPPAIERADEWNDKVDATLKALLGLTVGCARCHDHKYDPIAQKDYYRMAGIFANTSYKAYPLVPKATSDEYDAKKKELNAKEKELKKFRDDLTELESRVLFSQTENYMVGAWLAGSKKTASVASVAEEKKLDPEVLERWVRFLKKKPANYDYLIPWQKMAANGGSTDEAQTLAHTFYMKAVEIDQQHAKLKTENEAQLAKMKDPNDEKFDPMPNGIKRKLIQHQIDLKAMDREAGYLWRDLFEIDLPENPGNINAEEEGKGLFKIADWALQRRLSPEFAAHIDRLAAGIEAFKKAMPPEYPIAAGLEDVKDPSDLKVFERGNPYVFGEDAPRAFLSVLSEGEPKPFTKGSGRMEFAEAVLKQPLAMRVIVNRIWRWNMGTGIVDTPNNFGVAGDRPSDPPLLEYLAWRFVEDGMSWKKLTRQIVLSRTYQLSSGAVEANIAKDPDNRYYWRANRRRLEAEGLWDGVLSASGKLDVSKVGGASEELDVKMVRRGLYGAVSRVFPNEFQALFDFPIPTLSAERRYNTNTSLQRLFFLNSDFIRKNAATMAERVKAAGNEEAQVRKAFQIVFQRDPSPNELAASLELLRDVDATASSETPKPVSFAAKPAPDAGVAPAARASKEPPLQALCWALLSSNEFLFLN